MCVLPLRPAALAVVWLWLSAPGLVLGVLHPFLPLLWAGVWALALPLGFFPFRLSFQGGCVVLQRGLLFPVRLVLPPGALTALWWGSTPLLRRLGCCAAVGLVWGKPFFLPGVSRSCCIGLSCWAGR